jgi:aryl-alcohol dehydrogenase-like predicted oxidoreductase
MQYNELGGSGVEVSEVGFGAWVIGTDWWGNRGEKQAVEVVRHAFERGITFFDTGDVYGHGRSEKLVGEALGEIRDEVAIGTKVGYDFYNNPRAGHSERPKVFEPEYLHTAVDRSLNRLDTDHVDLLQLHNANVDEIDTDVLEVLDELRESGKVGAVGWALGPAIGWLAEGDAAIKHEFDTVQIVFNILEQVPGQHFLNTIDDLGAETSLIPRVPHSSGLLNEQVTPETNLDEDDHRSFRPVEWYETGWDKLNRLRFLERADDQSSSSSPSGNNGKRTMGQAAIQWLLAHNAVATVTPTFRTTEDIDKWAAAPTTPSLSDAELERVAGLSETNFGVERDDGMSGLRSSVDGIDLNAVDAKQASD